MAGRGVYMKESKTGIRFIYAVVHGLSDYIAYSREDVEEVRNAAKNAEAHGIPYFIIRGEL